jgi:hypothetical protein
VRVALAIKVMYERMSRLTGIVAIRSLCERRIVKCGGSQINVSNQGSLCEDISNNGVKLR